MDTQIGEKLEAAGIGDSKDKTRDAKSNMPFRARKGKVEVVKFSVVSRYDKKVLDEFDEYASNSMSFEIGDMVWGKVKSHPWWPGHVFSEVLASPEVRKTKVEGQVLVAFFGDSSYGWFNPCDLLPFDSNFSDKCKQKTSNRNFVKAVEEAVDEVSRRSGLAFACRCRNQDNFRDSGNEGYFCVDVCGYEPGSVYSADQIRKARDSFKPMEMVDFLNQLAASPTGNDDQDIEFMKKKAAVIAYRKAVYQEVDKTYDQAFGDIPNVRASLRKTLGTGHSTKLPIRAPLSGPLVIAEALGKGKGLAKPNKGKVQAKKEQYLFKRRDEANEFKSSVLINPIPVTSSEQPVYIKGSSAKVEDDYVLQKRSPSVSTEPLIQEKQEFTEMRAENYVSDTSEVRSEGIVMEDKFAAVEVGTAGGKNGSCELKLPQLLYNLKALALDPFHHSETSPTVIQQIVLKFRSLVFQKSLAPLPPTNSESKETRRSKPTAAVASNNVSAENARELKSENMQKLVVRPDDPAKGGRKRGHSGHLEEIAAKRKKIIDAKLLTDRKTSEKYSLMQRGEVKETSASTKKSVTPELVKKFEPLSRASDPTMLVLKFPLHGTLPSINELKARFIRFGELDHSACRVLWKSLTCRVVFRHKVDARAAYRYAAASNSMFGTTGIKCFLKEMESGANEQESGKVRRDEVSMSTSQLRDSTAEKRFASAFASQTVKQPGAQVKSILKREYGDEASGNGGIRGTSRVKFMLGGEENSQGAEQLMIGNKNSTNAIFSEGGTSTSHAIDFSSKNFQNITSSPLPPLLPTPTTGAFQFPGPPQSNFQYTVEAPRTNHNCNIPTADLITTSTPCIDISEQMMNLLTECNDIVNNVTAFLGYVPYHPL
ncbi:PWWP domain-containing protein 1-like [Apium graveolens]|uniref:PWWP domain-containing protein 1-like n=1 Tax=Apium graveolens TaxID=4045 RepID=UPI003D7B5056